jgi:hypothetical protein
MVPKIPVEFDTKFYPIDALEVALDSNSLCTYCNAIQNKIVTDEWSLIYIIKYIYI